MCIFQFIFRMRSGKYNSRQNHQNIPVYTVSYFEIHQIYNNHCCLTVGMLKALASPRTSTTDSSHPLMCVSHLDLVSASLPYQHGTSHHLLMNSTSTPTICRRSRKILTRETQQFLAITTIHTDDMKCIINVGDI